MPRLSRLAVVVTLLLTLALVVAALARLIWDDVVPPTGDPGQLSEVTYELPPALALPVFQDVAVDWGLGGWDITGSDALRGGVAIGDLNNDGFDDLALAGGSLQVFVSTLPQKAGFVPALTGVPGGLGSVTGDAISVAIGDLDGDGRRELLVGFSNEPALVLFGDGTADRLGEEERFTTGLIPADFDGDGRVDIAELVYDGPDLIWTQGANATFVPVELPQSDRQSMAAAVFDANSDGSPDLWVTRDVGWAQGADAVYTRDGASGNWRDVGPELGGAQAIDGMGVTVADLSGDGLLDVYLSDLGDNEVLLGRGNAEPFVSSEGLGIARIRPPGSSAPTVSSSWSSGVTDINHDGVLDLIVVNGGFVGGTEVPNKIEGSTIATIDPMSIFLGRGDGTYVDVWSELDIAMSNQFVSRGLAIGDLDGDRDADIIVTNFSIGDSAGLTVLRNDTPGDVALLQGGSCRDVEVSVRSERGEVVSILGGRSFLGHHASQLTVGVVGVAEVVVRSRPGDEPVLRSMPIVGNTTLDLSEMCR